MDRSKMNILISFDDTTWDYARHAAVTIISLLETNKKHRIKIYVMSSCLPQENVNELKRIVGLYKQEIEFIIDDDIVPEKLKKVIINKNNLTRWAWNRCFFTNYIKDIDRILYMDCDVLVMKDIEKIYNMDMHWKAIAWYYVIYPYCYKNKIYWNKYYFNSWVMLIDPKKYDVKKINVKKMEEINSKFSKYFRWSEEEKINIIFKDDVYIYKKWMNYQVVSKRFNKWLDDAEIVHCLSKPYVQYSHIPKKLVKLYYSYLDMTKWKWYPEEKADYWYLNYLFSNIKEFIYLLFVKIMWESLREKYAAWRFSKIYK